MSSQTRKKLFTVFSILAVALIGIFFYYKIRGQGRIPQEKDDKERVKNNITSYVTAERSDYRYRALGGISDLQISVTNNSDYLLENVKVKVIYIKLDGGVWQDKYVDFNSIDPHSKMTLKIPDTDRGVKVEYQIASIKSDALNLN
jgi:hypothetical protein